MRRPPALGDQVDRLGGAAHEDDLALVGGVQEDAHLFARLLEAVGRAGAELIDPAMHIGVVGAVELGDTIDHRTRLLRAGARIQKDQLGMTGEDRELAPHRARIEPAHCRLLNVQRQRCHA